MEEKQAPQQPDTNDSPIGQHPATTASDREEGKQTADETGITDDKETATKRANDEKDLGKIA